MKLLTGATPGGYALRTRDIGTYGARGVLSFSVYCDTIGTTAAANHFYFTTCNGSKRLGCMFGTDGLFIYSGAAWVEVGTDLVSQDVWQQWTFDVNWTARTVDVYLDNVLKASAVNSDYGSALANGTTYLLQYGTGTANQLSYVDWFKAGSNFV
jgi:hypothetical protein